ncbi:NUDIX domain-containing protein [Immersiella caudata]|uniref:NUDIX domain-containing protein n=1 Tax=Immersiella caudata TaxID=314043 RepID=A0AA39XCI4_9PEZI|nr:NUDIX domain-containing protein [Immersiella caudata]
MSSEQKPALDLSAPEGAKKERKRVPVRPSSSILLLSPTNQVLLLHRVQTSSSFASAHVFPGGNLSSFHEGELPPLESEEIHRDSEAYRLAAVRETFEESGILLARRQDGGQLLSVSSGVMEAGRKEVHGNRVKFGDWLRSIGGAPDLDNLIPFTRWISPIGGPKRFSTQMYLYMLPLSNPAPGTPEHQTIIHTPTHDGGLEHTAATFDDASAWISRARAGEIVLFPPQCYLLNLVSEFTKDTPQQGDATAHYQAQRDALIQFLQRVPTSRPEAPSTVKPHPTAQIPWAEKVMSPTSLFIRRGDRRFVLGLDKPGPELKGSGRGGDWDRVVLVEFKKEGPTGVEVRLRDEVLKNEREGGEESEGAKL